MDCFASYYNNVGKFFSRFWNPACRGVHFFVQSLEGENCLVVPPVNLIARAIHYLHVSKTIATITRTLLALVIVLTHYFQKIF